MADELSGEKVRKVNRTRPIFLKVAVNEEEQTLLREKMLSAGTTNFSLYARKMILDGYVVHNDFSALKDLTRQLAGIGRNVNQIAHRANESRSVQERDVQKLREQFYELKRAVSAHIVGLLGEDDGYY